MSIAECVCGATYDPEVGHSCYMRIIAPDRPYAAGLIGDLFGDAPDRDRWADHDADFTPPLVVRQGLTAIASLLGMPSRVWDPAAGAGIFGQVAGSLWRAKLEDLGVPLQLYANEVREEERPHLARHYDTIAIADATTSPACADRSVAAVATNPPWNLWPSIARAGLRALDHRGWMALLGPVSWGASFEGAEALDLFVETPPILELRIPGRIRYRTGTNPRTGRAYGSDHRKCAWWVWAPDARELVRSAVAGMRPAAIAHWTTAVLPALPAEALRWTVRPGEGELPV